MFSLHSTADQCNGSSPQFLSGLNTSRLFPQVLMSLILGILCKRLVDWKIRRSQGSAFQMLTKMSWNKLILTGTANAILRFQFSNASESCSNLFEIVEAALSLSSSSDMQDWNEVKPFLV
jgi:hypothetical protein